MVKICELPSKIMSSKKVFIGIIFWYDILLTIVFIHPKLEECKTTKMAVYQLLPKRLLSNQTVKNEEHSDMIYSMCNVTVGLKTYISISAGGDSAGNFSTMDLSNVR